MKKENKFEKIYEDVKKLKELNLQMSALVEEIENLDKLKLDPEYAKIRVEIIKKEVFSKLKDSEILEHQILKTIKDDR
ncbi:MAG: hypothetical protein QW210_00255 [Candidatus Woesearchaeota archaeon]